MKQYQYIMQHIDEALVEAKIRIGDSLSKDLSPYARVQAQETAGSYLSRVSILALELELLNSTSEMQKEIDVTIDINEFIKQSRAQKVIDNHIIDLRKRSMP